LQVVDAPARKNFGEQRTKLAWSTLRVPSCEWLCSGASIPLWNSPTGWSTGLSREILDRSSVARGNEQAVAEQPGQFPVNSLLFSVDDSFRQCSSGFLNQSNNSLFFSLLNSLF